MGVHLSVRFASSMPFRLAMSWWRAASMKIPENTIATNDVLSWLSSMAKAAAGVNIPQEYHKSA
jgi:hypothetical protein